MNSKHHVIILSILTLSIKFVPAPAQISAIICAGQKGIQYQVTGDAGSTFHWMVGGGQIISDVHGNKITVNWGETPGLYTIEVTEEKSTGCLGFTKKLIIGIQPSPTINLGGINNICEGDFIELNKNTTLPPNQNKYLWQDGSSNATYLTSKGGMYWVEVTSPNGCVRRDTVLLTVKPLPTVNLGRDTMLCSSSEILLDAGNPGNSYSWKNGITSQTYVAHENEGLVWVAVTDNNNCTGRDSIIIFKCTAHDSLIIPKVFLPHKEGRQNYWTMGGIEKYPEITVKIYDRWGILVFVSDKGYSKPWDGKSQGKELPMDAYYYIIKKGDGSKEVVGSVTLIR